MAEDIRVLVAIEVRLYREGLARLLSAEPGIVVTGTAHDAVSTLDHCRSLRPDVVLLDCALARACATFHAIHEISPAMRIVALGISDADPELLSFARAGMDGYVTRDGTGEQLVASIRGAARGEFICSPQVAALLLRQVAQAEPRPASAEGLTRRERQVAELVRQDLSNKAIATRLNIELSTVKNHVHNILGKLHVRHRRQLARSGSMDPETLRRY